MTKKTMFAPADRAPPDRIEHDTRVLAEAGIVDHMTHVIPSILMVLNKQRQIVYSNQRLLDFLKIDSDHQVLGLRPGEILNCIHAQQKGCSGCGTTEFCSECGAVKAILESQDKKVGVEGECRITTTNGGALELKVWASPYLYENAEFTTFTLIDIHDKKRREALEQAFFHDMANVLSAISGHSKLLELSHNNEETSESIKGIRIASKKLADELWCQRKLMQAEAGELQLEMSSGINTFDVMDELVKLCPERTVELDPNSDEFELTTDRTLLFRILFNMVKNANEAAAENETVTLSCKRESRTGIFSVHNPNFMPRSTQLQIFQRSFSTKGQGHGLGTYSMRLFGEKFLKGKVGFTTSKKLGTTFYFALPLGNLNN
ncbi:MAG: ATP-binding protein [Kiritimatiellaceae bacterium]|nr:ATP-binding protein [Kiritimatiellaceae bacterium]